MALNRYDQPTQLDLSFQIYNPVEWQPNMQLWGNVFGKMQQQLDAIRDLPVPKHIDKDKPYVRSKVDELEQSRNDVIAAYKEGNLAAGRKLQGELLSNVKRSVKPGGWMYEAQTRYSQLSEVDKRLQDKFIDGDLNPVLYKFYKDNLLNSIQGMSEDDQGNLQANSIGLPNMIKHYTDENLQSIFSNVADNITADQVVRGPYRQQVAGMSFKDLLVSGKHKFIDYDKAATIMAKAVSPEIAQHFSVLGQALGYQDDQGQLWDMENNLDEYGNPTQFANTMLGRLVDSYASSKVFNQQDVDYKVLTDDLALHQAKKRIDEADYAYRTMVHNKGSGMPEWDVQKFTEDGYLSGFKIEERYSPIEKGNVLKKVYTKNMDMPYKRYLSEVAQKEDPAMYQVYQQFKNHVDKLDNAEALKFIKAKYQEKRDALSMTEEVILGYDPKKADRMKTMFLGQVSPDGEDVITPGIIRNMQVWVVDGDDPPKKVNYETLIKESGAGSVGNFIRRSNLHGEIRSDNDYVLSGIQGSYENPKKPGKFTTFYIETGDHKLAQENAPIAHWHAAASQGAVQRTTPAYSGVPELDAQIGPMYAVGSDIYQTDILTQRLANDSTLTDEDKKAIEDRIDYLMKNPLENSYEGRRAELRNMEGFPVLDNETGEPLTIEDVMQLIRSRNARQQF